MAYAIVLTKQTEAALSAMTGLQAAATKRAAAEDRLDADAEWDD